MRYRTLGRRDLRVSEIGLGTWAVGGSLDLGGRPTAYGHVPESEAAAAVERALDLGVNFFDTSDSYGLGRAERLLGEVVGPRRGQVVVAAKIGWVPDGRERWVADLSPAHIEAAARRSLTRLGFDAIDLLQLHAVPAEGRETDDALDALEALRSEGIAKAVGASVGFDIDAGRRLVKSGRIDTLQVHYNLLHPGASFDLLEEAHRAGVGVIVSSPLSYGFLGGRYTRGTRFARDDWRSALTEDEVAARVARVGELRWLTREGERSLLHASLQFVLAHPAVATTVAGFRNAAQVEGLVAAQDALPLNDIEVARAREQARSWAVAAEPV